MNESADQELMVVSQELIPHWVLKVELCLFRTFCDDCKAKTILGRHLTV